MQFHRIFERAFFNTLAGKTSSKICHRGSQSAKYQKVKGCLAEELFLDKKCDYFRKKAQLSEGQSESE